MLSTVCNHNLSNGLWISDSSIKLQYSGWIENDDDYDDDDHDGDDNDDNDYDFFFKLHSFIKYLKCYKYKSRLKGDLHLAGLQRLTTIKLKRKKRRTSCII